MIASLSALELQQIPNAFDDPDWVFEIKFDGFRSLAKIEAGECTLISRNNNVFKRFDGLRRALPANLKGVRDAGLDGEVVVLDAEGRSLFNPLMSSKSSPVFAAFDVLWLNGDDLRDEPLLERKRRLRTLVKRTPQSDRFWDRWRRSSRSAIGAPAASYDDVGNPRMRAQNAGLYC